MNPWECPNCQTIYAGWVDRCNCKKAQVPTIKDTLIIEKLKGAEHTTHPVCEFCKQRHAKGQSCFKYHGFCVSTDYGEGI